MTDIDIALQHFKETQDEYLEAEDYYEGNINEKFTSERLRRALSGTQINPVLNFTRTPVNAVANRLEITAAATSDERAQQFIDDLWESNELDVESEDAHLWSLVYGDGYLMVWPDEESYTVNFNTPLTTALFYDDENPRRKRFAAKLWLEDGFTRLNLYYPNEVYKFISKKQEPVHEAKELKPYVDEGTDDSGFMESPFDFIPVFHLRTRKPYGSPEHKAAFGAQDLVVKNIMSQMVSNDYHGLPQRYILSETNPENFLDDEEEPELTAGAGEVWWLENVKTVGQFDAASPGDYLEPFREYIKSIASLTDTPIHYFEAGFNAPSGESLRVAEAPLVKKVKSRQAVFGGAWKALLSALLAYEGYDPDVAISWAPAESQSDKEMWEQVKTMQDAGLSLESALRFGTNLDERAIEQILGGTDATQDSRPQTVTA